MKKPDCPARKSGDEWPSALEATQPPSQNGFFTETGSRLTGIDKSSFVVYLRETSHDNVGVGGELLEDKYTKK